ncbi:MAG: polyphosphate kinase 1 [Myxococcota bacterium]|nr:polyphosphate kinase 1 [Myxococcota bacterium]
MVHADELRASVDDLRVSTPPATEPRYDPALFVNRELSWLEFNERVLGEARDPAVPLLERLKFLCIVAANLDEFFMVRVAGLIGQVTDRVMEVGPDGLTPAEQLARISARTRRMLDDIADVLNQQLLPELAQHGVRLVTMADLDPAARERVSRHFREQVLPILTPLAIDPGHPFPHVRNRSLNLVAMLAHLGGGEDADPAFAVVQVPGVLPRLVPVPASDETGRAFLLLEDVLAGHLEELFPGFRTLGAWPFRVIRNFDLTLEEEEAEDLLQVISEEVRRRDRGNAVRLTVARSVAPSALAMLSKALGVMPEFVFPVDMPLDLPALAAMGEPLADRRGLRDEPFTPVVLPPLRDVEPEDIYAVVAREDVLLHHPYESFDPVVWFIEQAAVDPAVLALKMTLYRTSGDSPIVKALMRAAEAGKSVTALVELKARFDEEANIQWARKMEEAGVHVVYGLVGLKTHCKVALVVRREHEPGVGTVLRRYVHLGTGNYNPTTARLYTDLSLLTARADFAEDVTSLFNLLTSCTAPSQWRKLTIAPLGLHERVLALIEREAQQALEGRPARIIAKMNALVDPDVIAALYRASQAGVSVDLIVRGICCLRAGVPGVSDNIRVRSIVDRFLEHARIWYFEAAGAREVYLSSADWMPRNFVRRVEVMYPIEDPRLRARVIDEILRVQLEDNQKAHEMRPDGSYARVVAPADATPVRSQQVLLRMAREAAQRADSRARNDRPFVLRPTRVRPGKTTTGSSD